MRGRFHFLGDHMNTRDQLLAKLTLPVEPVEVDGMTIYLRDVSYGTQLKIADMRLAEQEKISPAMIAEFQRLTILDCVCDEQGNPLLSADDWETVKRSNGKLIVSLWEKINERNSAKEEDAGNASGVAGSAVNESSSQSPSAAGQATSIAGQ
jgi:hypothetical protein